MKSPKIPPHKTDREVNTKTYREMRVYALKMGFESLQDALRLPHRYEFIAQFKKQQEK